MSPFVEPYIPEPREPLGRRTAGRALYWLERLFRADVAVGPGVLMALVPIFAIAGWSVGGVVGEIFRPSAKFLFQLGGAIIGLILVKPALGFRTPRGYLGVASAGLLAILVSCGAGSVGQLATMSRRTVTAVRLEAGDTTVAAKQCIFEAQYDMGLLSREETDDLCGYKTTVQPSKEGESPIIRYREVPKPSPLLYIWELVKLLAVVGILVFVFKKP